MFKCNIASHAKLAFEFKSIKLRLSNTIENIKFNKTCLNLQVIPNYVQVKINTKTIPAIKTKQFAEEFWIRNEIKFLYKKKDMLNTLLYNKHLELARHTHPAQLGHIMNKINSQVSQQILKKKKTQQTKINSLLIRKSSNQQKINIKHTFYQRVVNLTNIQFNEDEINILNKGLKHNFKTGSLNKNLLTELINAESAIKSVKNEQNEIVLRSIIDKKVERINHQQMKYKKVYNNNKNEIRLLNNIKHKLNAHKSLITKADKGQSIVIMEINNYVDKVNSFLKDNNINILNKDPTAQFNTQLKSALNKTKHLFTSNEIRQLKMIDPKAPTLRGLPKVHKHNVPIRPLVNFTTAPSYKISKKLDTILRNHIKLQNNNSVKNSLQLITMTDNLEIVDRHVMASLDITNLYTNIPVNTTIEIIKTNLENNSTMDSKHIKELITMLKTVLEQNYFIFNDSYYIQEDGLAMGSPLSSIMAEVYLNHVENLHILSDKNPQKDKILFYKRYVDDIFLIFNGNTRQLEVLCKYVNGLTPKLKFTLETECTGTLNFLDLTIKKKDNKLQFSIYRKPTTTDHTIHATSYHSQSVKMSAYNSLVHRLLSVPLSVEDYANEVNIIKHIATVNGYNCDIVQKIIKKFTKNKKAQSYTNLTKDTVANKKQTFVSIEYGELLHHTLKNELKKHNIILACKTTNKLEKHVNTKQGTISNKYDRSGIYKLNCNDCNKIYIGQTGRKFKTRFSEHIPKSTLVQKSKFAEHLVNERHNINKIDTNMEILHKCKKSNRMTTLEEMEIYNHFKKEPHNMLNDKLKYNHNIIFERINLIKLADKKTDVSQGQDMLDAG